jgi:hypothetical protein
VCWGGKDEKRAEGGITSDPRDQETLAPEVTKDQTRCKDEPNGRSEALRVENNNDGSIRHATKTRRVLTKQAETPAREVVAKGGIEQQ